MKPRYPIWLTGPGEPPGRQRLAGRPDMDRDGPDDGLILIDVPGYEGLELGATDSDDRYPWGWLGPHAELLPADPDDPHYHGCYVARCEHVTELPCSYERTDAGWWLTVRLPDGRVVWTHETDVPIDNHPDGRNFARRPTAEEGAA